MLASTFIWMVFANADLKIDLRDAEGAGQRFQLGLMQFGEPCEYSIAGFQQMHLDLATIDSARLSFD